MIEHLEYLPQAVAPADFGGHSCYVVLASDLPHDLRPDRETWAFTAQALDLALADYLTECGRWRGRGAAIVLNNEAILRDADQAAGGDTETADFLYGQWMVCALLHETAHTLERPLDLSPSKHDEALGLFLQGSLRRQCRVETPTTTPPVQTTKIVPPWITHGAAFIRTLCHGKRRAERLLRVRLPGRLLYDHRSYHVSCLSSYEWSLRDELRTFDHQLGTFDQLRNTQPPQEFLDHWIADVHRWRLKQDNQDEGSGPQ